MVTNSRGAVVGGSVAAPGVAHSAGMALPVRTSQLTALRFLLMYTANANPPLSLAAGWPKLHSLLRNALTTSDGGCMPPLLLLVLWEWMRRLIPLGETHNPLSRPRERKEATELCEHLIRATVSTVSRANRSGNAASATGGGLGQRHAYGSDDLLPSLDPHSTAWDGHEPGVVALLALERCLIPLLRNLYVSSSSKRAEQAVNLIASAVPSILVPLEQRILEPAHATELTSAATAVSSDDASTAAAVVGSLPTAVVAIEGRSADRKAEAALRVLLQVLQLSTATRAWRSHVGRLFGLPRFFAGLTRRTLPLASAVALKRAWPACRWPPEMLGCVVPTPMSFNISGHVRVCMHAS